MTSERVFEMRWSFTSLGANIVGFGLAAGVQGACSLLLVPVIARALSNEDLSRWAVLEAVLLLLPGLLILGAHHQLLRIRPSAIRGKGSTPESIIRGSILIAASLCVFIFVPASLIFGPTISVLLSLNLLFDATALTEQFRNRALGSYVGYASVTAGRVILFLSISAVFWIASDKLSLQEILGFRLFATILTIIPLVVRLRIKLLFISRLHSRFKASARYGLPIALAAAALTGGDLLERSILLGSADATDVAEYYVHARMVGIISLGLITPIALAFPLFRRRILDLPHNLQHSRLATFQGLALSTGVTMILALIAFAPRLVPLIAPRLTADQMLLLMLACGGLMKGLGTIFGIGLFSSGGSRVILVGAVLSIAVGTTIGVALLRWDPTRGMGLGSLCSGVLYLLWVVYHSNKVKRIGIQLPILSATIVLPLLIFVYYMAES